MTVLSVFIPTAIAVAVIFLFRSLDKENNSMGKITNYVKRKMGECDAYFAGQTEHLEGLKADLDTRQTTAAAAVKRLEQQIEDFKRMSSGFERHFSAVDAIGEKIASYGTVINELMDMTARVEENLAHIRDESDVIDDISASIAAQKKTVDAIEKKIPQINEKFAARNEENLKMIGTELLNQYQLRAQQVDQSTRAAADRSEKMLAKLEADIRRAYDEAAKRAAQLDDTAFKRLSEQIQARNDAFVRELGARTKELEAQMRTKIAEVSGQLRGETDAIKKQFGDTLVQAKKTASELHAEVNGNGKTLETLRASLEKQMIDVQARYDQLYEKAVAEADAKETAKYNEFQEKSARHLEFFKTKIEREINDMHSEVDATITAIDGEIKGKISAVQDDMNDKVAGLQGSLQTAERTKADLEVFQKQADEQIAAVSKKLEQLTGRLSTMYDTKQTELLSLVDSQLAEYRKNLEYRFGRLEQIGADVDSLEKNLRLTLEQTQGRVVSDFTAFTAAQERKQAEFARTVKLNSDDIAGQIDLLEKNLNDIKATASDNVSTALKDFEENFSADLQRRGGRIDDELNAWKQHMEERLASLAGDFENDRRSIETKYGDDLKAALVGHEAQVQAKVAELSEQLRGATEAVRNQFSGSLEQAKRMADELSAEVNGNGKTLETLRASLEKQMADIQARYDQLYEKALADADEKGNLALSQLERVASRQLDSYKAAVDEKITAMQDGVGATINSVNTELSGRITAMQGAVNTAVNALDGEVKEKIGTMQERLDAAVGSIGEEVRGKISTIQNDMTTAVSALDGEVKEKIGTIQNDMNTAVSAVDERVREKIGAMQERVSAAVGTIGEEVRGKISAIQNDVNTAVTSLDGEFRTKITAIKDNVNATVADVSGELRQKISAVEDNVQVAVTAVDEKIKGKLSAMQDSMNGTVAVLQGSLQAAERTKADLQAFQKQADEQIAAVSQKLAQLTEKVSAVYDTKQTELLSLVEGQIAEYRSNLEYRFGKLEQIGADVDVLEKNLRQALELTEGRVTDKFTAFTEAQKQRQAEFAQSVKDNNDGIVAQIALLEENLNKIKATASDNVSATLKDFEENFTTDLRRRSSKIDDDLNAWKQNLDSKLVVLTGDFENGRRELEQKYAENIKANFSELEAKNREQTERYEADLVKSLEDIRQRVADAEQTVRSFTDRTNADLQTATDGFNTLVKTNLDAYTRRIDDEIAKTQRETGEKLAAIEQSVQDRQEAHKSNIDAMLGDFQAWRAQLKVQFDQTKELFTKQIGSLHAASNQRFEEIRNEFDQNLKEFAESAQTRQRGIVADVDGLQEKIEAALADYQTRSDQTLAEQQRLYEEMLQETQRRVREQNAESEKALRELRTQIQNVTEETDRHEAEITMRMQTDTNDLQMRFSDIDQKVKAFTAQMQVYQTADALKAKLDSEISMLKNELAKIENYQSAMQNLQAHFSQIQTLNDDMNRKLNRFVTEKNHIDSMEHKFDRLVTMSGEMDEKIRELTTTSDDLQAVQVSVRKFQETLGDISSRYDRLEKKQEVIEQVSSDVDRSFENLKNLEERLGNALRQTSDLPEAIKTIQRDIDSLMTSSGKINDAVDKVTSIQNLLADTEARMQQIQAARNGIAGAETRLQHLDKQIDDKMSLLLRATQADMAKNPGPQSSRITPQDRETIIQLKRQGWTVDEIARRMKRSEGEVELILEMPSN
ncbi:MAG: hypothetical protein K2N31_00645 [Treponemataceae bacterium]|nr:hypothetical protein [Treponemataceae bacterium]